jgi:tetratricopeptide (TPR) repeat protein
VYEQVLNQAPEKHEIRKRAAELAVNIGLVDAAEHQLKKLREEFPKDGRVLFLSGVCHEIQKRFDAAEEEYKRSYEAEPRADTYVRRAAVLRRLDRKADADQVIDNLAEKLPGNYESHLACALYLRTYPDLNRSNLLHLLSPEDHLKMARDFAPGRSEVLIASAHCEIELAQKARRAEPGSVKIAEHCETARSFLRLGLEKNPKDEGLYLALADVETINGNRRKAVEVLTTARKILPQNRSRAVLLALAEQYAEMFTEPNARTDDLRASISDTLSALKKLGEDAAKIDFVRGLSLVRQGQWYDASGVLERVRPLFATQLHQVVRIDLLLAYCYGKLGDIDRQLITYRRAIAATPLDSRPRQGLADVLAAIGRNEEAIAEYRHVTRMERSDLSAWLSLARMLINQNLAKQEKDRHWDEVSGLLNTIKKTAKDIVEVPLLEAEVRFAKSDAKGARELLAENLKLYPTQAAFWCALAVLEDREGDNKAAHALLDKAIDPVGDTVDIRIARIRLTRFDSIKDVSATLAKIGEGMEHFALEERVRLLRALASAYWQIGQPADSTMVKSEEAGAMREAGRLWGQVALLQPTELQVRLLQFDVCLKLDDESGMTLVLKEINRIEGGGPYGKYGEGSRLIWRAVKREDRSGLVEARRLLMAAVALRSNWPRIPLNLSVIDDLEQNREDAISHLKEAIDLGDRQLVVIKRLVAYLNESRRSKEANEILSLLQTQSPLSNELQRVAAEVSLQVPDMARALSLAQMAVDANTRDYKERVWLAQIFSVSGKWKEADENFKAAIELAGDNLDPLPWTSTIQHILRQRDTTPGERARQDFTAKLEDVLKQAEKKLGKRAPLVLTECYELADKSELTEDGYRSAIAANPHDARPVRALAAFFQKQGNPQKSEPFLRRLLADELKASPQDVSWARRNLALALALRSESPDFEEANRLLDLNASLKATLEEEVDDLRTRAIVSSRRPGGRQEVIALLEKAEKLKRPLPEHEFLLAKLYEAEGMWAKASHRLINLITSHENNPVYLTAFANSLIRRGELAEAEVWTKRLVEIAPNQEGTLILLVDVTCRLGRAKEAVPPLREYSESKNGTPADPAHRALIAGELFDRAFASGAGQQAKEDAEKSYILYRELSKEPGAVLQLAAFYARNDVPDRALALCEGALTNCPIEQVMVVAVTSLSGGSARPEHFAKVEEWLTKALDKQPDADNLRYMFAILRESQGRFADAEAEYRKILAHSPKNLFALNNLAFLLALTGRQSEALDMMKTSSKSLTYNLRETQAVALLAAGNLNVARTEMEAVVIDSGSAVAYFHLAEVLSKLKLDSQARAALQKAQLAGVRLGQLHPLERPVYLKLVAEMKQ